MSLRRPQNIMSGLSSGMQSVGKGVLGGAAALIAAPVVGARSEGWSGFAKGLGAGLAAANHLNEVCHTCATYCQHRFVFVPFLPRRDVARAWPSFFICESIHRCRGPCRSRRPP